MIALNDDTIICDDCYFEEQQECWPESNPGRIPFVRLAHGTCASCGKTAEEEEGNE